MLALFQSRTGGGAIRRLISQFACLCLPLFLAFPVYADEVGNTWQGIMGNDPALSGVTGDPGIMNPFLPYSQDAFPLAGTFFQGRMSFSISNDNWAIGDPAAEIDPNSPLFSTPTGFHTYMAVTGFARETGQTDAQGYPVFAPDTDHAFTITYTTTEGRLDFPFFKDPRFNHIDFHPGVVFSTWI